jgi:ribosome-associated translation inhibitor RaiA
MTTPRTPVRKRRERQRKPDSKKRAPFPDSVPKALKRRSGPEDALRVPAHIRSLGVEIDDDDRSYIHRKLGMKLGKFASSVERVSVRMDDANGPRGGIDQICRIKVVLSGLPSVVVETRDASVEAAIDGALAGVERAVRRTLKRRRMKPLKGAANVARPRARDEDAIHVS